MEAKNKRSTVCFSQNCNKNGIFADIDTSERQTVSQIVDQLLGSSALEPSLCRFCVDINGVMEVGRFVDDYSTTALEAPELPEKFIHQLCVHVRGSIVANNTVSLLAEVLKMEKLTYHTITWVEDQKSNYILSKQ